MAYTTIDRAIDLAQSGRFSRVAAIEAQLLDEGFKDAHDALSCSVIRKHLNDIFRVKRGDTE